MKKAAFLAAARAPNPFFSLLHELKAIALQTRGCFVLIRQYLTARQSVVTFCPCFPLHRAPFCHMSDSKRVDVSKTHKGLLALLMIRNQVAFVSLCH
jgi:hypothetical protein